VLIFTGKWCHTCCQAVGMVVFLSEEEEMQCFLN